MKICPQCKIEFNPNPRQKYCSLECRDKFHLTNRKIKCVGCGDEFRGSRREKYCSKCKDDYEPEKKVTVFCAKCGARHNRKSMYCSKSCYSSATKVSHRTYDGKCEYCGKEYKNGGKRFCNKSCSANYRIYVMGILPHSNK